MQRPLAALAVVIVALVVAGCSTTPSGPSAAPGSGTADPPAPCSPTTAVAGWSDALDGTRFDERPVASLSALAAQRDGTILALADRSTLFTLDPSATRPLAAQQLVGPDGLQLDSEAVALEPGGTRLITNETGPQVLRYRPDGALVGGLPVPPQLAVSPAGQSRFNKTFEGIARQPDGTVVTALEGPASGDDAGTTRLVTWSPDGAPAAQYAVPLASGFGISELAPTGDGRLLMIERAFSSAVGNTVVLVLADPRGAPDVRSVWPLPAGVPTVRTTVLADLGTCPSLGATSRQHQTNPLLDNVEGMTITGRDPDGALRLLLVSDNNGSSSQVTRTYRLRTTLPPG